MKAQSEDLLIGIASGLAAAWIMNAFQSAWSVTRTRRPQKPGQEEPESEPSTVKAADRVSEVVKGGPVGEPYRAAAGEAVHYSFGAYLGAFYALTGFAFPQVRAGFGTFYGTAVWLVADEFLVPAGGLSPPPRQVPASTHVYAFVSHLVFGAALEGSRRLLADVRQKVGD